MLAVMHAKHSRLRRNICWSLICGLTSWLLNEWLHLIGIMKTFKCLREKITPRTILEMGSTDIVATCICMQISFFFLYFFFFNFLYSCNKCCLFYSSHSRYFLLFLCFCLEIFVWLHFFFLSLSHTYTKLREGLCKLSYNSTH